MEVSCSRVKAALIRNVVYLFGRSIVGGCSLSDGVNHFKNFVLLAG